MILIPFLQGMPKDRWLQAGIFHVMRPWGINPTSPWEWEHTQDMPGRKEAGPDLFDVLWLLC